MDSWCAGYADVPIRDILKCSQFCSHLLPEDALSSHNWQSCIAEKWQGSLVVFTVPEGSQQACVAQIQLARLVQLLRYLLIALHVTMAVVPCILIFVSGEQCYSAS